MKLIVVALLFVNLAVCIQSSSMSIIGDICIERDDGEWICDKITCPEDSDVFRLVNSNQENPSVIKSVNTCYSKHKEILAQRSWSAPVDPSYRIKQNITLYLHGQPSTSGDNTESGAGDNINSEEDFN